MRILRWERRNIWMEEIFYELGGVEVRVVKGGGGGVEGREEEKEIGRVLS